MAEVRYKYFTIQNTTPKKQNFQESLGGTVPHPKLSMFCELPQNYQHFFWKNNMSILKQIVCETNKKK